MERLDAVLCIVTANAAPVDVEAVVLRYPRDPQGISVAIQELQPVFQTCIDHIPVEGERAHC